LLRIKIQKEEPENEEEIKVLLEQGMQDGEFEAAEQDMVEGIFRMSDRTVEVIMTPRTELEWIDLDEPQDKNLALIANSNHTRFPVAQGSLDNVAGILVSKDLLTAQLRDKPLDLRSLLQPPLLVPESMPALKVLELFKTSGNHIALVIDEYGGLLGMVTLFDVLKSIVGELPQNAGDLQPQSFQRDDGSWLMDGLMPVDEFKDLLELNDLPDEDRVGYQTLGGFVMNQLGEVPSAGQMFTWDQYKFEVMDMDGRRVDKILITPLPDEELKANSKRGAE
jgi:putative hemolysin